MAQIMLQEEINKAGLAKSVVVTSTGVSDEEAGNRIDHRAANTLARHDYPQGEGHHAQQVTFSDLDEADLVLPMTAYHARAIRQLAAKGGAQPEVRLFRSFDPAAPKAMDQSDEYLLDVEDPWYGNEEHFEECYNQLKAALPGIVAYVKDQISAN